MTGNQGDAEDVVQETFLRAYRQLSVFQRRCAFSSWIYRIAANCALDLIRGRRALEKEIASTLPSTGPAPDRVVFSDEVRQRVEEAMSLLTGQERAAFVLRHYEGLTSEQLGDALGIAPGAAKHAVFRAVQKLRRALEPVVGTAR
jgi:RNA polymerase sigma-70 factor (ECF subfamily)